MSKVGKTMDPLNENCSSGSRFYVAAEEVQTRSVHDELIPKHRSWMQKCFVVLRPEWKKSSRQFWTLQEISGSLGDIGTFLPLVTALAINHENGRAQIPFGSALFYAGVYTLLISTYFETPIPVQPMKTIASVALLGNYPREQILAAGISSGVIMLLLAVSGLIKILDRIIPLSLVRGIQLGLGLGLMIKGFKLAYVNATVVSFSNLVKTNDIEWFGWDSIFMSGILGFLSLAFISNKRVPVAILLFLYGIAIAIYRYRSLKDTLDLADLTIGPDLQSPICPSLEDFKISFTNMVLPQIPLTILNSVIALEKLSEDLFPGKKVGITKSSLSIGMGNVLFCWLGMLPSCHGAGGLASQYAFGARSNVSMIFLGICKVFLALLFGSSLVVLLQDGIFPSCVLGVMLLFSGLNLALVARDISDVNGMVVMLMTAGLSLARDTGAGFLFGAVTALILHYLPYSTAEKPSINLLGRV